MILSETGVPLYGCGFLSLPTVAAPALSPSMTASEIIDPLCGSFLPLPVYALDGGSRIALNVSMTTSEAGVID